MRKYLIFVLVITFMFGLVACKKAPSPILPASSSTTSNEVEIPKFDRITSLRCVKPNTIPTFISYDLNRLVVYQEDFENNLTTISMVDMAKDKVLYTKEFNHSYTVYGSRVGDYIALYDFEEHYFSFFDEKLEPAGTFEVEDGFGYFSHDGKLYYYVEKDSLYSISVETGEKSKVELKQNLGISSITAMHPTKNILSVSVRTSAYSYEARAALLDLDTKEYISLNDELNNIYFSDFYYVSSSFDESSSSSSTMYGTEDSFKLISASAFEEFGGENTFIQGSNYLYSLTENTALYCIADTGLSICRLADNGLEGCVMVMTWLKDSFIIAGAVFNDNAFDIYLMNPFELSFEHCHTAETIESPIYVDDTLYERVKQQAEGEALDSKYDQLCNKADQIEDKYNIEVFISSQCSPLSEIADYPLKATDSMDFESEKDLILNALTELDRALSAYPEGMFEQMKLDSGDGGLRILLVKEIESNGQYVGLAFERANWYNNAIDITSYNLESIFYHEIWHSMESYIISKNATSFMEDQWQTYNPQGFEYYGSVAADRNDTGKYCLADMKNGIYFIDDYAKTDSREDRARIMEYVMSGIVTSDIQRYPAIKQKLQIMCDAVRACFDTTDWENIPWEKYI